MIANIRPEERGKCQHCQTTVRFEHPSQWHNHKDHSLLFSPQRGLMVYVAQCPECTQFTVELVDMVLDEMGEGIPKRQVIVWPISGGREPLPKSVPENIKQDYEEAALIVGLSPKASAALSRRCLQTLLREAGKTKSKNLYDQIEEVIPELPSRISENLHIVRVIGNFAAHPLKSKSSGTIVDTEIGEAEWNLDVLDALFDYYYIRPAIEEQKRDELNKKLTDAGKQPIPRAKQDENLEDKGK